MFASTDKGRRTATRGETLRNKGCGATEVIISPLSRADRAKWGGCNGWTGVQSRPDRAGLTLLPVGGADRIGMVAADSTERGETFRRAAALSRA